MTRRLHPYLCGAFLLPVALLSAREPSSLEQYYLELVNRARANPNAEVVRLSGKPWGDDPDNNPATPDLNEGLAAGTITSAENRRSPLTPG